jgi:hypothetical protein
MLNVGFMFCIKSSYNSSMVEWERYDQQVGLAESLVVIMLDSGN